ncbi:MULTISPECIES: hypothetical protein [Amycolatopsis]|uniref:YggT family protein n=2 Tax=Amycolatopsis TaxID=1813 RepID=A0A3N2H3Q8_9PSEU|nr:MULTISPECIES: hypothetical protein [Amycolatopsis]MCF6428141.1 hypothetical protein [Amycolatopsis tucumanensis]ROS43547.1 hypothetical protein EDD35_5966 [Amycolatopsis thermoflava]
MARTGIYRGRGTAVRVVTGIGALFALVEAIYIVLVLAGANTANAFYRFIDSIAQPLALFFPGLFPIANGQLNVLVNYGLAAVFWLVVTGLIARLLR